MRQKNRTFHLKLEDKILKNKKRKRSVGYIESRKEVRRD